MEDPVSKREYSTTIDGVKEWGATEFPYGLPLLYALVGFFAITTTMVTSSFTLLTILGWSFPTLLYFVIAIMGVMWAYGGWIHGEEAQKEIDVDKHPPVDFDD